MNWFIRRLYAFSESVIALFRGQMRVFFCEFVLEGGFVIWLFIFLVIYLHIR